MSDPLMTRDEVAALLGIKPNSVRDTLRRYGITEQRGYPRALVENLKRPGQGRRTDLENPMYTVTFSTPQQAEWLAAMPRLAGNGHRVQVDGRQITLSEKALAVLSREADDNDGHFDGSNIWIGGSQYVVTVL